MSRKSQHMRFEDKILGQVSFGGFPATCASLFCADPPYVEKPSWQGRAHWFQAALRFCSFSSLPCYPNHPTSPPPTTPVWKRPDYPTPTECNWDSRFMQTHAFIQVLIVGSVWKKVLSSEMKGNAGGKYMESATGKDKTGSGWLVLRWPLLVTGCKIDAITGLTSALIIIKAVYSHCSLSGLYWLLGCTLQSLCWHLPW